MTFAWTCGPVRGECATADELMQMIADCAPHHRFVARDGRGRIVACIDLDQPHEPQAEIPIVRANGAPK